MKNNIAIAEIKLSVSRCGTQEKAAQELGISQTYLSDLLHGRRNPSDAILRKLGLRRIVVRDF
jgi:transcriptional regulator with XRE-family HTH domain